MKFRSSIAAFVTAVVLSGCGGEGQGVPETETTGSVPPPTSTISETTTGSTGGTVSNMAPDDKEFVSSAGMLGLAEVQMGNLGMSRATHAAVKAFAERIVADHTASNAELSQLATTKGLALPTELAGPPRTALEHLTGLTGAGFDSAFMAHMVEDHQKAVADFERASSGSADPDVKAFASRNLPVLQGHLAQAQELAAKVK